MSVVLDASAVLALLFDERGGDVVSSHAAGALISTVNLTEVLEKVAERDGDPDRARAILSSIGVIPVPFSERQAQLAAELKPLLRGKRIALADRACLALVRDTGRPVLTGDRVWTALDLGIDVRLIR